MLRHGFRLLCGAAALTILLTQVPAQDKPDPGKPAPALKEPIKDDYREFFKAPRTSMEFWEALQFEMELGRHELAARLLRGLVGLGATDQELMRIHEKEGSLAPILRLRTVPRWSDDPVAHAQAIKDAETLAERVSAALRTILGDPARIARLTNDLSGDAEERAFATRELYRSRDLAIPHLVTILRTGTPEQRDAILALIPRLAPETVTPLLAALDIPDSTLRLSLIRALQRRNSEEAGPHMFYLSGAPNVTPEVRSAAKRALAQLLRRPEEALLAPADALTREAERYERHEIRFANPASITLWRWDEEKKELVSSVANQDKAEEHYGLRFARQALEIDPNHRPAQEVLLSLIVDKAVTRAGVDQPLTKQPPQVQQALAAVDSALLLNLLERGLKENRIPIILGAIRALTDRHEGSGLRPSAGGEGGLLRALNYPDRRVQWAAAEAVLRQPGDPGSSVAGRVVEVLRKASAPQATASAKPKVLVGFSSESLLQSAGKAVREAGYEPVLAHSGREVIQRLESASDIDALVLDVALPDPGFASLLAQLRSGIGYAQLPVWFVLPGETQENLLQQRQIVDASLRAMRTNRDNLTAEIARTQQTQNRTSDPNKSKEIAQRLETLQRQLQAVALDKEEPLRAELRRIDVEIRTAPRDRERSLSLFLERYRGVWLVSQVRATNGKSLKEILNPHFAGVTGKPLTEAERKEGSERALAWLSRIARGELPSYDLQPAEGALYGALRNSALPEESVRHALDAIGRLPTSRAQMELTNVILDDKRQLPLRLTAATALQRHIQRHSPVLNAVQIRALRELSLAPMADAGLRGTVGTLVGSIQGSGSVLRDYTPAAPATPAKDDKPAAKEEKP